MPTGLKLPISVNASGGFATVSSGENSHKIVAIACSDDSNENAFQQNIGMGISMIFNINDPITQATIQRRLVEIFRRLQNQQRYILQEDTINWTEGDPAEMVLEFEYIDIESNEPRFFRRSFVAVTGGEL